MGIYIDMEIPEKQVYVILNPNGLVEVLDVNNVLLEEYQAVPVPKHGRLIDADALTISTAVPLDGKPYQYAHIDNIKAAPTIIPAEESE